MNYTKYPRTFHVPWSDGITNDDKVHRDMSWFIDRQVAVTIKMDGENTSIYKDHIHARSADSRHHVSRDWVKQFAATLQYEIPDMWRVCGENMFAEHSIRYDTLESYFLGFSVWNENNICLSWPKTIEWFNRLGIVPVKTIYMGEYNEKLIRMIGDPFIKEGAEGYVIRPVDCFNYDDFGKKVAKCVRKDHVETDKHWIHQEVVPNQLRVKS